MQNEIWKDVPGYSGLYQVSNLGRVKSIERYDAKKHRVKERILKQANRGNGYKVVVLFSNGHKMYAVHRLVALAFIPNPDGLPQINHKNEIKKDKKEITMLRIWNGVHQNKTRISGLFGKEFPSQEKNL